MTISDHLENFAGLPTQDFDPERGLEQPETIAYRLSMDYEAADSGTTFASLFEPLLADPRVNQLNALIIGAWGMVGEGDSVETVIELLVAASRQLRGLKGLFIGDIVCEESEISWIEQTDLSPLFGAFPLLEELGIRGGNGLSLGRPQHTRLRKLVIESGGLSRDVVQEVAAADLPQLEHLELWLGDDGYGNDVTTEDLAPILSGKMFPKLRYLGLRDDCKADETAQALANSPLVGRLEVLDLSLGTLGDVGALALLASPAVQSLKRLDLHHHYISEPVAQQLLALKPEVDLSDRCEENVYNGEAYRYVAVAE